MKVEKVSVSDFEASIIASGYPMQVHVEDAAADFIRAEKLGTNELSSGHGNYMTGILVSFDLTCTHAMLAQFERYHFAQIVSSQSKMHRILKFDIEKSCHPLTDSECFAIVKRKVDAYNKNPTRSNYQSIIYSTPIGMELTMRITTNYMQLLTMYFQRRNHRLDEWVDFCKWIKSLQFMDVLIDGIAKRKDETLRIRIANCDTTFQEQLAYFADEMDEFMTAFRNLMKDEKLKGIKLSDLKPIGQNGPTIDNLLDRVRSEAADVSRCGLKVIKDHLLGDNETLQRVLYLEDQKNGFKGYYNKQADSKE